MVCAAALFAVMLVVVEDESVVAGTGVGADRVFAYVLAAAVIDGTLIFVYRQSVCYKGTNKQWNEGGKCLPVKKRAAKPLFCTEVSVLNSMRRLLLTEVTICGIFGPQNTPCFLYSVSEDLLRTSTLSYSQSCY